MDVRIDYWSISRGITQDQAKAIAAAEGFEFELGRISRFENARNAVVIAKADTQNELVNRVLLAEEIQHGHDRQMHEAAKALRRGLSNREFHAELFERMLERYRAGDLSFLTDGDVQGILQILKDLRS